MRLENAVYARHTVVSVCVFVCLKIAQKITKKILSSICWLWLFFSTAGLWFFNKLQIFLLCTSYLRGVTFRVGRKDFSLPEKNILNIVTFE